MGFMRKEAPANHRLASVLSSSDALPCQSFLCGLWVLNSKEAWTNHRLVAGLGSSDAPALPGDNVGTM